MEAKDWITIASVLLSPIIAVWIGQLLQNRKTDSDREYNNKLTVFASLLGLRHLKAYDDNFVIAVNQVPVVFHDNSAILEKYLRFVALSKDTTRDAQTVLSELDALLSDMLILMAADLGYSNIDNETLKNPYAPDGVMLRRLVEYNQDEKNAAILNNSVAQKTDDGDQARKG